MKERIRSLRLAQLSNTPLSNEQLILEKDILFIQSVLNKLVLRKDNLTYPSFNFYFIENELFFQYNIKSKYLFCRYDKFWHVLEKEKRYLFTEIHILLDEIISEHFNMKVITTTISEYRAPIIEEHFNKSLI